MKPLEVVAAVFYRDGKVLVCRRKPGLSNAGLWEFPGGKRDSGESREAALVREILEEFNVTIRAEHLEDHALGVNTHHTETALIELHCFVVNWWHGEFTPTDHDKLQWCTADELQKIALSEADVPFVSRIDAYVCAKQQ